MKFSGDKMGGLKADAMRSVRSVAGFPRMCGVAMVGRLLVAALLVVGLAPASWANSLTDFAVFGGGDVFIFDGCTVNGQVGSNGSVFLGSGTSIGPSSGGGAFYSDGGNLVRGDLNFNGFVDKDKRPQGVILGPHDVVDGNILTIENGFYDAAGATHGTVGWATEPYSILDLSNTGYSVDPLTSSPLPVTPAVTLSGGNPYYYSGDIFMNALDLTLDLTHGPIYVYVTGDVSLSNVHVWLADGGTPVSYDDALANPTSSCPGPERALRDHRIVEQHGRVVRPHLCP